MTTARRLGVLAATLAALAAGEGLARESGSPFRLGPQERSYDEPGGNRSRDILDNRFEGRRPPDPGRYDRTAPLLGPDGELLDEDARRQWEQEQSIRGFREESREEYGLAPEQAETAPLAEEQPPEAQDPDDAAWQEELQRRNPLPAGRPLRD